MISRPRLIFSSDESIQSLLAKWGIDPRLVDTVRIHIEPHEPVRVEIWRVAQEGDLGELLGTYLLAETPKEEPR